MRAFSFAAFGMAVLVLCGCAPKILRGSYISLEEIPDVRVVERSKANLGENQHFVSAVPTRYEIIREGYTLTLQTNATLYAPTISVTISPYPAYRIVPVSAESPHPYLRWSEDLGQAGRWTLRETNPVSIRLKPSERHLRFGVLDETGATIATEDIPYTLRHDGFIIFIDAI